MQSKKHSLLETLTQSGSGFILAFLLNLFLLPFFGFHPSASQSFWMTAVFMAASIIRGYFLRRFFNWLHCKELL